MPSHHTNAGRKFTFRYAFFAAWILLVASTPALAQGGGVDMSGNGGRHRITGRMVFPSGQRADLRLKIRLESSGSGDITVLSDMNGSFSFQSLRAGSYTVVVEGGDFYETIRESVYIEPGTTSTRRMPGTVSISRPVTVQVYLRSKASTTNKPGVLPAALAAVPKDAADLYLEGMESAAREDSNKAIDQLKKAIDLHPAFSLALDELGVQYLKIGQPDKAVAVLRSAVELSPDAYQPRLHYGIALLYLKRFAEAEAQFRESLKQNDSASTSHMYLGITLVNLKNYSEAEIVLKKAVSLGGSKVSQAHYYLGGLYWRAKDYQRAVEELEKYLLLEPKAANAEKIRATIKELRNKS